MTLLEMYLLANGGGGGNDSANKEIIEALNNKFGFEFSIDEYNPREVVLKINELDDPEVAKENKEFKKSVIDIAETATNFEGLKGPPWILGNPYNLINLPFLHTGNLRGNLSSTQGTLPIAGIREIGFDLSSVTTFHYAFWGSYLQKLWLLGVSRQATDSPSLESLFYNRSSLKEIYIDKFSVENTTNKSFKWMFQGCTKLEVIGGFNPETLKEDESYGKIDFTSCLYTDNMFTNCSKLREVRFEPDTLKLTLNMTTCPMLSENSIISILNSCAQSEGNIITFNSAIVYKIPSIMSVIKTATSKGWTIKFGTTTVTGDEAI